MQIPFFIGQSNDPYEVTGAAVATMLSNLRSLGYFIFVYFRLKGKTVLTMLPRYANPERRLIGAIFSIGLPSALTALLANLTSIVKNNLTSRYGDIEMAAYGIVIKADMLPLNIGMGLCQGMMPLVAYNYAAKNYPRMKAFTKAAQVAGMTAACAFIVVSELLAPQILGICRQGLFALPILLIMNHFVGLYGVVAAQLISDGLTFVFSTLIYRRVYNRLCVEAE